MVHAIYEAPAQAYGRAEPLFESAWYDRAYIDAVFEGRQRARLFVDDPLAPRAELLCRTYEYFVAGDAAPAEAGVFAELYGYVPVGEAWERALLADYGSRLERIGRHAFTYHGQAAPLTSRDRLQVSLGAGMSRCRL